MGFCIWYFGLELKWPLWLCTAAVDGLSRAFGDGEESMVSCVCFPFLFLFFSLFVFLEVNSPTYLLKLVLSEYILELGYNVNSQMENESALIWFS